jgi:hypothetical protein
MSALFLVSLILEGFGNLDGHFFGIYQFYGRNFEVLYL